MRIAHLASFQGNVGDVINHEGLYENLRRTFATNLSITKIEIRDFYKNSRIRSFDEQFIEQVNTHDLFIIGGGNFFELCWDYSKTGTTVDLSIPLLKTIRAPILINAIGVDDGKGISKENIKKFERFLVELQNKNAFITVRNDGSYEILTKYMSKELTGNISEIPDTAFYIANVLQDKAYTERTKIGFNIVTDMKEIRFKNLDYDAWLKKLRGRIEWILESTNYEVVFFPHILSDYQIILDVVSALPAKFSRQRVSIGSLVQGKELDILDEYRECVFVFASRFHANISCIALGIPCFATVSYHKHGILFDKLNLQARKCFIDDDKFFELMDKEIENIIENSDQLELISKEYKAITNSLTQELEQNFIKVKEWYYSF